MSRYYYGEIDSIKENLKIALNHLKDISNQANKCISEKEKNEYDNLQEATLSGLIDNISMAIKVIENSEKPLENNFPTKISIMTPEQKEQIKKQTESKDTNKELEKAVIDNFNEAYNEWGCEECSSKEEFINKFIDAEFWDMGSDFFDYEDWRDYRDAIPELKQYNDELSDFELDNWDLTRIKQLIANWETKIIKEAIAKEKLNENNSTRIAKDIKWDVDYYEDEYEEDIELPKEVEIPDYINDEEIGDYLSDTYGFCHDGFNLEIINK